MINLHAIFAMLLWTEENSIFSSPSISKVKYYNSALSY